jgi:hypothetical protein
MGGLNRNQQGWAGAFEMFGDCVGDLTRDSSNSRCRSAKCGSPAPRQRPGSAAAATAATARAKSKYEGLPVYGH